MDKRELIRELIALKPRLAAEGVAHLALFGSRARESSSWESDIDLLIDVEPDVKFSILNLVGVEQIIADATGLPANAFMRRSLDHDFQASVGPDVIELF